MNPIDQVYLDDLNKDFEFACHARAAEASLIELEQYILTHMGRMLDDLKLTTSNGTWTFSNE